MRRMPTVSPKSDLAEEVETRAGDDTFILAAMKRMRDDLAQRSGHSAPRTGRGLSQIAVGNAQLSSYGGAATSLEDRGGMEELAGTVKQNLQRAPGRALALSASAAQGNERVARMVATMNDISSGSARIVEIISGDHGIAFQTNILALNAAVEAPAAGGDAPRWSPPARSRTFGRRRDQGLTIPRRAWPTARAWSARRAPPSPRGRRETGERPRARDRDALSEQSRRAAGQQDGHRDGPWCGRTRPAQESLAAAEAMRQQAETLSTLVSQFRLPAEDVDAAAADTAATLPVTTARAPTSPPLPAAPRGPAQAVLPGREAEEWEQF